MPVYHAMLAIHTQRQGTHEITDLVAGEVLRCKIRQGIVTVFCQHTSCSLVIMENADPSARRDLVWIGRCGGDGARRRQFRGQWSRLRRRNAGMSRSSISGTVRRASGWAGVGACPAGAPSGGGQASAGVDGSGTAVAMGAPDAPLTEDSATTGTGLKRLADLPGLIHLSLHAGTKVGDADLAALPDFPALQTVSLTSNGDRIAGRFAILGIIQIDHRFSGGHCFDQRGMRAAHFRRAISRDSCSQSSAPRGAGPREKVRSLQHRLHAPGWLGACHRTAWSTVISNVVCEPR